MNEKYDFFGLKFQLLDETAEKDIQREFLLAESFEEDYVFQIICTSGYDSGRIMGFVKTEDEVKNKNVRGVTRQHLINELHRNIIFNEASLVFVE